MYDLVVFIKPFYAVFQKLNSLLCITVIVGSLCKVNTFMTDENLQIMSSFNLALPSSSGSGRSE
jgi:hypothetical protein